MNRENRYQIIKRKDITAYLTTEEQEALDDIARKINRHRLMDGKEVLQAVVVEHDWPEYEPTWAAIEARMAPHHEPVICDACNSPELCKEYGKACDNGPNPIAHKVSISATTIKVFCPHCEYENDGFISDPRGAESVECEECMTSFDVAGDAIVEFN